MRIQFALLRHEWRLQAHSLRFRLGLLLFTIVTMAPPVLTAQLAWRQSTEPSTAELVAETFAVLPFAGLLLALVAAGNAARLHGERELLLSARISGFGFLIRKSVALATLVLPPTLVVLAVPLLVPLVLWSVPPTADVLETTLWRWLLEVLPRVLIGITGWLALVRALRHEVAAFIAVVFGSSLLLEAVNRGLLYFRVRIAPGDWTGFETAGRWAEMIPYRLENGIRGEASVPVSAAPFPLDLALQGLVSTLPILLAFTLAAFTLGALLLGRSAADAPPLRLGPEHPVRTLALGADRVRAGLRPDAGLTPRERGVATACLLLALLLASVPVVRSRHFRSLLEERYHTEWQQPGEATSTDLEPRRFTLRGRLDAGGDVDIHSALELHNAGPSPIDHLAFELNRGLELSWNEPTPPARESRRGWNRLEVDLASPITPGGDVVLAASMTGTPVALFIPLLGWNEATFSDRFEGFLAARFPRDVSHLRDARVLPLTGDRSIRLDLSSLAPRPRFTSWVPQFQDASGERAAARRLLPERHKPLVTVEIDLELPSSWFLADPCGNVSRPVPGTQSARLQAECRVPLSELIFLGGAYRPRSDEAHRAIVATRTHQQRRADGLLETMDRVVQLSGRAWPGLEPVDRLVAVEVPIPFGSKSPFYRSKPVEVHGQLLGVPEMHLSWAVDPIDERQLVASIVVPRLPSPEVVDQQRLLTEQLLTTVLMRRMGLHEQTAVMWGRPWDMVPLSRSLLLAEPHHQATWAQRLPAVLFALESRVGAAALVSSLDDFLRSPPLMREGGQERRDLHDWLEQLETLTGADLEFLWRDYIAGTTLPELLIEEIEVRRLRREEHAVHATLVNRGSGETRCPVVVRSEREEIETLVTVTGESSTPFVLRTRARPHTLVLDPNETCLRFRARNAKESFRLMEEGT